jgi:hypothetical protein
LKTIKIVYNIVDNMANKQQGESSIPKLPSLNFGKKPMGFGAINRGVTPKSFIPPPVRVTQNKGSGGK